MLAPAFRRAFSLIELVIVIVIIAIIAAIAIPRMSRGASGAAESSLTADLAVLRNSIDLYQTEHGGTFPDLVATPTQLTQFTDDNGNVNAAKNATFYLGPYLRSIPALPVGADKGKSSFIAAYAAGSGWVYVQVSGTVKANCAAGEVDSRGIALNTY